MLTQLITVSTTWPIHKLKQSDTRERTVTRKELDHVSFWQVWTSISNFRLIKKSAYQEHQDFKCVPICFFFPTSYTWLDTRPYYYYWVMEHSHSKCTRPHAWHPIESTGFKNIFLNQFLPRISSESGHMSRNATSHSCLNLPQSEDQCICQKNTQVKILSYQHQCLLKEQSKDGYERKHHEWWWLEQTWACI